MNEWKPMAQSPQCLVCDQSCPLASAHLTCFLYILKEFWHQNHSAKRKRNGEVHDGLDLFTCSPLFSLRGSSKLDQNRAEAPPVWLQVTCWWWPGIQTTPSIRATPGMAGTHNDAITLKSCQAAYSTSLSESWIDNPNRTHKTNKRKMLTKSPEEIWYGIWRANTSHLTITFHLLTFQTMRAWNDQGSKICGMLPNFTMASWASKVEIWNISPGTRRPISVLIQAECAHMWPWNEICKVVPELVVSVVVVVMVVEKCSRKVAVVVSGM